jgi:hypothetical protein
MSEVTENRTVPCSCSRRVKEDNNDQSEQTLVDRKDGSTSYSLTCAAYMINLLTVRQTVWSNRVVYVA